MFNCFDFYVTPSLFQDERPIQVTLLSRFYPLTGHQNEKVTSKVKQLSKQTETCLSTNVFSSSVLRQRLAIFDFSILHGHR